VYPDFYQEGKIRPKIVDEQMCQTTMRHILREVVREFTHLGFDQDNIKMIAEQVSVIARQILEGIRTNHS
jgi:hypothetical protein